MSPLRESLGKYDRLRASKQPLPAKENDQNESGSQHAEKNESNFLVSRVHENLLQ